MPHSLHRSSRFLNVFTVSAVTTDSGSLFQCVTTRWLKKFFSQFQSASSGVEFQLMSSCAVMFLIQHEETVRINLPVRIL